MPKLVCYGLGDGIVPDVTPLQPPNLNRVGNIDQVVCHTLRFLTHFVLFLKSADSDIPVINIFFFRNFFCGLSTIICLNLEIVSFVQTASLVAHYIMICFSPV